MSKAAYLAAGAVYAIMVAAVVVFLADYYESPGLLIAQLVLIAGPAFAPFLTFARFKKTGPISWFVVAIVLAIGWGYVVYLDTRPYQGGGATMAVIVGWFASAVTALVPVSLALIRRARHAAPDPQWRTPPRY